MASGTHQVVSKHSILSARRRGTPRRSKHSREALRHRLKQIGATGESDRSHDTKATTQSDFKVYDQGRSKTELTDSRRKCRNRCHHAPTRRSGRIDEVLEKLHEILEDFRSLKAEVLAESNKQAERRETEESGRERDGIGGSSCVAWDVIAKPEADKEDEVDEAETRFAEGMVEEEGTDWERGEADLTFQKEQPPPEPPPELKLSLPPTFIAAMVELHPVSDLGERCLSFVAESCNRYWGEAKAEKEIDKKGVAVDGLAEKYFKTQFVKSHSNIFEEAELSITFSLYGLRIKGPQNWCSDLVEHLNKSWIHCFNNPLPCKARSNNKPLTVKEVEQFLEEEVIHVDLYKVWQLKVNNITFISELSHGRGGYHQTKKIDCTPYYNFNARVFRDLNQLMKKRNTMEWTAAPSYQNHAVHVGNFCLEISQLHGKEQVGDLSGKWEMIYDGEDIEFPEGVNSGIYKKKIHQVFLKFQQESCFADNYGGNSMSSKTSKNNPVFYKKESIVTEFIVDREIVMVHKFRARQNPILVPSGYFVFAIMSHVFIEDFRPLQWMSLQLIVVKIEHIQWEPGGNYYSLLMCLIESLSFKLWNFGGLFFLLLEYCCPIQEMKIVMIRQVVHEDVGVLNNRNGILFFNNLISHQVIMLALFVILNWEWGAHKSDDFENITQVWLQTRQEIWVEHLIQELGSSRRPMREAHYKQWDPGEPYLVSYIIGTSCFKLWDPGGRVLIVCFGIFTLRTR